MGNKPIVEAVKILLKPYEKPTSSVSVSILVKRLANAFRKLTINVVLKLHTVSCEQCLHTKVSVLVSVLVIFHLKSISIGSVTKKWNRCITTIETPSC